MNPIDDIADIVEDNVEVFDIDAMLTEEYMNTCVPYIPKKLSLSTVSSRVNVSFNDKTIQTQFVATARVVEFKSNFCRGIWPGYTPKKHKSKPRTVKVALGALPRKERKKQGDGSCMQSCISFIVQSRTIPDKIYDIKHFNTGTIQIPGRITESMDDVRFALEDLVEFEKAYFPQIEIIQDFFINMNNYNFMLFPYVNKVPMFVLRLAELYRILIEARTNQAPADPDRHTLQIDTIKYEFGEPMMYINFLSPTVKKINKHIVLSVSHYGKCNIQGGYADPVPTDLIYDFALTLFRSNRQLFIRRAPAMAAITESMSTIAIAPPRVI